MPLSAAERKQRYKEKHPERVKEQARDYYYNNLEHCKEVRNQWMRENATHMKELRAQIIPCDCGSNVRRGEYSKHRKTKKHLKYEEDKTTEPYITPNTCEVIRSKRNKSPSVEEE